MDTGYDSVEVIIMAKEGMKRQERQHNHARNTEPPVPEIRHEKPIPDAYSTIDTDLARDNIENHLTFADLQDLR